MKRSDVAKLIPHDLFRIYRRSIYHDERYLHDRLKSEGPETPMDLSLKPCVEKGAIFIHIPKCAGISIALELFGCRAGGHLTLTNYKQIFSQKDFDRLFKFTFVRNPWDRLISAYHFICEGGMNESDKLVADHSVRRFTGFNDFVENYMMKENFEDILHFQHQWNFVCETDVSPPKVDFIGRYENLANDFQTVSASLGQSKTLPLSNASQSRPRDYRMSYTDRTRDIVREIYARDISLFGYSF